MLGSDEFERWIKASHSMYTIFEDRYDAYPLSVKWIDEWLNTGRFVTKEGDKERVLTLIKNFNYDVYSLKGRQKKKIDEQFKKLAENCLPIAESTNVGFAISPYLFTWNFQRFKEYFKKKDKFDLQQYFTGLGEFLQGKKDKLNCFRGRNLLSDITEQERIREIFEEINSELKKLGISQNEPVGTAKILHICAPRYFPLLDNRIANVIGLTRKRDPLTSDSYLKWVESVKSWLQNYSEIIGDLQSKFDFSILKLLDEGLYLMSSINLGLRVKRLSLKVIR